MSFVMTVAERESFFAGIHVGVLSVARDGRGPLAVPVWYSYEPGGEILIWMVQSEVRPYKYVSTEGPVVANDEPPTREQALAIASRYLPRDEAVAYVDGALGAASVLVRMRPERWLSTDYGKMDPP